MARMTEEEAWALSDYVTNNEITLGPNGSGWLTQRELAANASSIIRLLGMQDKTVSYLLTKAAETHKSPGQLIDELVSKELSAAV